MTITFAAPDAEFPPAFGHAAGYRLFLYDIRENRELRSNEWARRAPQRRHGQQEPRAGAHRLPHRITAWASATSNTPAQDEHRLLGEVMKVLLRFSTIPAAILQGSLQGQEPPLPATSLQPGRLQSISDFWQTLGGRPRAALTYTVTIGVVPEAPMERARP